MRHNLNSQQMTDFLNGDLVFLVRRTSYIMYWMYDLGRKSIWFYSKSMLGTDYDRSEKGYSDEPNQIYDDYFGEIELVSYSDISLYTRKSRRYVNDM